MSGTRAHPVFPGGDSAEPKGWSGEYGPDERAKTWVRALLLLARSAC